MDTCVIWLRARSKGYGQMQKDGRLQYVHRVVYEAENGPIAAGLQIDHLCRTPLCFNTDHLRAVTPRINTLAGDGPAAVNARKTRCLRGHLLIGENLRPAHLRTGRRACRTCYIDAKRQTRRRTP